MNVLLLIRSLNVGGAERQVVTLSRSLSDAGHNVDVAIFSSGGSLESELLENKNVSLHVLKRRKLLGVVGLALQVRMLTKRNKYDAIYSFLPIPNLATLGVLGIRNRPKIVWGVRSSNLNLAEYPAKVRRSMQLEKFFARWADLIISNSFAAKTEYCDRGYPANEFTAIQNAIDINRFSPDPSSLAKTRRSYDIPEDAVVIGIFARIHPKKDHATFLKAAAKLTETQPNAYFVCVGGQAPEDAQFVIQQKELANDLNIAKRVRWLGEQSAPEILMNACTITTLSSSSGEGFPNSVAESAACGVPCVTTDSGDAKKIIEDHRFVVPPSDPIALANAWQTALTLPENEMTDYRQKLRQSIVDRFSPVEITGKLESALTR